MSGVLLIRFQDKVVMLQSHCGYATGSQENVRRFHLSSLSPNCALRKIVIYCMGNGGPQIVNTPTRQISSLVSVVVACASVSAISPNTDVSTRYQLFFLTLSQTPLADAHTEKSGDSLELRHHLLHKASEKGQKD